MVQRQQWEDWNQQIITREKEYSDDPAASQNFAPVYASANQEVGGEESTWEKISSCICRTDSAASRYVQEPAANEIPYGRRQKGVSEQVDAIEKSVQSPILVSKCRRHDFTVYGLAFN